MNLPGTEAAFRRFCQAGGFGSVASVVDFGLVPWPSVRSGIYAWMALDGCGYVGQSTDVRSRLASHLKRHGDILFFAWLPADQGELDALEHAMIRQLEAALPLRNIKLARNTVARVPFDGLEDGSIGLPDLSDLRRKQSERAKRFLRSDFEGYLAACTRTFVLNGIDLCWPAEGRFWGCTASEDFVRVNCGQQEVFTCEWITPQEVLIRLLLPDKLGLRHTGQLYQTASYCYEMPIGEFLKFEYWDKVAGFTRELMRHTTPLHVKSHVPQVFDAIRDLDLETK